MNLLREIAEKLNHTPTDIADGDWGSMSISSSLLMNNIEPMVYKYRKLFRRKKLHYEDGLYLYIYSFPSFRLYELIRKECILRECRGIIMSPLGVRNRPFPVIPTIEWKDALELIEYATIKINGLMFTGLPVRNKIYLLNKGGKAIRIEDKYYNRVKRLIRDADILGLTPIFEYTDENKPFVIREKSGCYLVGLRSIRTGKMALSSDLIEIANIYELDKVTEVTKTDLLNIGRTIEGIVVNDGENISRAKTADFKKLQKITSILRYNRRGDLNDIVPDVDTGLLVENLTNRELEILKRRKLL